MSSTERPLPGRTAGFTLIELLVALVISGLLATVILQLVKGQGDFVSMQSAREEVQQNTRGALELVTSELRAVPPGGITTAGQNRIVFQLPRAWGLLCDAPSLAGGTTGMVFATGTFPADFPPPGNLDSDQAAEWGLAIPAGVDDAYVAASLSSSATDNGSCPASLNASQGAWKDVRQLGYNALSASSIVPAGTEAFLFQRVEYDASTGSVPGVWLRRRIGSYAPQPVAGPLLTADGATSSPGGLVFTYYCRDAAGGYRPLTETERTLPANLVRIDRVQVKLAMQSRNRLAASGVREQQSDSMIVHLRNRQGAATCP